MVREHKTKKLMYKQLSNLANNFLCVRFCFLRLNELSSYNKGLNIYSYFLVALLDFDILSFTFLLPACQIGSSPTTKFSTWYFIDPSKSCHRETDEHTIVNKKDGYIYSQGSRKLNSG